MSYDDGLAMPKKTVDVKRGEYRAYVKEFNLGRAVAGYWVNPTRVYRGGPGRQSIEYMQDGEKRIRENHPGAASFDLYKRVW